MMKTTNQSPRCARASSSVLRYSIVFLLGAAIVAAQGRIAKPPAQTNSTGSGKRSHVATLRSSDSPEGSRIALSSDQSLNDYEAYRRGDRFYIKIPAADVPRTDALRGRGFADVRVQRVGDSTIISFRLPPGATARVEQRSNRLEIVFTVAGGSSSIASNAGRDLPGSITGTRSNRNANTNQRSAAPNSANKNAAARSTSAGARNAGSSNRNSGNSNSARSAVNSNRGAGNSNRGAGNSNRGAGNSNVASKTGPGAAVASNSRSKPVATPIPSPLPSPSAKAPKPTPTATPTPTPTPTPAQTSSTKALASPTIQSTPVAANQSNEQTASQPRQDRWSRIKERINYWILLAQLNPIPVATGAVLLLLLIALFLFQRRRARSTRRVRPSVTKSTRSTTTKDTVPSVQKPLESKSVPDVTPAVVEAAAIPSVVAVTPNSEAEPATDVAPSPTDDPRRERIAQVNEAAKKLLNGGEYDESIIGSSDRETRQLVGAELLSAIVGRSDSRRELARAAFMKHGYFDDATRDLRIAESPNERAAAARRLSFVHDKEATPHLIGALDDPSPDVRRTAVEALMDLRDPAAIGPLNSLMQTENDRKVPRTLLKHAIDACATAAADEVPPIAAPSNTPQALPDPSSHPVQTEREVIEL
jgi:hypothetical protein